MPFPRPICNSRCTASITATYRLAICAESVNKLILARLQSCYPAVSTGTKYRALEKPSQNLVTALAQSTRAKLAATGPHDPAAYVCLRCGGSFTPS